MELSTFVVMVTVAISSLVTVESAAYNEACSANSDCTTDANTVCVKAYGPSCTGGQCLCLSHMIWDTSASKCKVRKYNIDKCETLNNFCMGGTVCSGGQCVCTGGVLYAYNTALEKCQPIAKKAIGGDCTTVSDCNVDITDSVECMITSASATQKKCTCKTGYITYGGSCKKPYTDHACTTSVGCAPLVDISGTYSQQEPEECSSTTSLCTCPTGSTTKKWEILGRYFYICVNPGSPSGTLLAIGATCTLNIDCTDKLCMACPESTTPSVKTCLNTTELSVPIWSGSGGILRYYPLTS